MAYDSKKSKEEPPKEQPAAVKEESKPVIELPMTAVAPLAPVVATTAKSVLRVASKAPKGFRRAGISFGPTATDIELSSLTAEQIKAIKAEPMLVAVEAIVEVPQE